MSALSTELLSIANGQSVAAEGRVEQLADAWISGLGERATPGVKADVASALNGKHERARADLLLPVVRRAQ